MGRIEDKTQEEDSLCLWKSLLLKGMSTTGQEMNLNIRAGDTIYECKGCPTGNPECAAYVPMSRMKEYALREQGKSD